MKLQALFLACFLGLLSASPFLMSGVVKANAASPPLAAFTYIPCVACVPPGDVVFFNGNWSVGPNGPIVSYTWNFGDGSPPVKTTSPSIIHDYLLPTPAMWLVTLAVQDSSGQTDTVSQLVVFNIEPQFTLQPRHPFVNQPVLFNASSSIVFITPPSSVGFQWSFGDGNIGSGKVTIHSYTAIGLYRVSLTLITSQGNPQISETVIVIPPSGTIVINKTLVFDGVTLTVSGSLMLNLTARTLSGTISVVVTNSTTGAIILFKIFTISLSFGTSNNIRLVLALPTSPFQLGIACTIVSGPTPGATCAVSRNPDLNNDGTVDLIDLSQIAFAFGTSTGSPRFNPAADLNADSTVDIVDISTAAIEFQAPVF